jgi:hypothetical protein
VGKVTSCCRPSGTVNGGSLGGEALASLSVRFDHHECWGPLVPGMLLACF